MLDWLLLTKRPQYMQHMVPDTWKTAWPKHVWAMTSVENQEQAEQRIPLLIPIPSSIHGLSVEPLLSQVDLLPWLEHIQWVIVGGESGHHARQMHPEWVRTIRNQCQRFGVAFFFKQWGQFYPIEEGNNGTYQIVFRHMSKKAAGRVLDGQTWDELPTMV